MPEKIVTTFYLAKKNFWGTWSFGSVDVTIEPSEYTGKDIDIAPD
jgi:hypothetical protein